MEQAYAMELANMWFWIGLITGTGIGMFFSALIRFVTEGRD
jgi:hypothetical protein